MVILNAPTYFAAMWGVIKQMIDPRTAKRIQVFSSLAKGKARLLELIDPTQIPKDYGGGGPTLASIAEELSHQSGKETKTRIKKTIVEPIQLKRKGTREIRVQLESGEAGHLNIYTRSATSAKVSLHRMDSSTRQSASIRSMFEQTAKGRSIETEDSVKGKQGNARFGPVKITIGQKLVGPAAFLIKLHDLGENAPSGVPSGQFVIVGEVS